MKTYAEMEYHPASEQLVQILCDKTQNTNPLFFRVIVAYYFCQVASMMRCNINTLDRGEIPVNMYAINLMISGGGKGRSTNIMEEQVINQFLERFTEETFHLLAEENLPILSQRRAARKSEDPDDELIRTRKEFKDLGPMVTSFDSATAPAVKQARDKLLMANAGSLNLQMDEVGSNLSSSMEALITMLELYDVGKVKAKLIKNTKDNSRVEEIKGRTPANMLLFGTPPRLLDGGKTEEEFYTFLETGAARRCIYGYARVHDKEQGLTPALILARNTDKSANSFIETLSDQLYALADISFVNKNLHVSEEVTLLFIEYQLACEARADLLPEHDDMRKAELSHRYFKAMKLAGGYAFIDSSPDLSLEHAYFAIKLVEDSGDAFEQILTRDRPYVKLARYLADIKRPVTQPDLVQDLPFYKGSQQQKQEMLQLAIAHGYQNNILIKKSYSDGIEFLRGETLVKTDLHKMRVSWSTDIAQGYRDDIAEFSKLHMMAQRPDIHWCSHYFKDGHRCDDATIAGFNLIVLDVDGGVDMNTAMTLLRDYKALFYTTKRHTAADHRFRIVMPTNYHLELDGADFKEFMHNIFDWLPFGVDDQSGQRARKWMSNAGTYTYQDGQNFDVLPFIPKTTKNETFKARVLDQQGMSNLERWVINNIGDGNRNNMLLRYAMILVDAGFDYNGVLNKITELNNKLPDKLADGELLSTVMVTAGKALAKK